MSKITPTKSCLKFIHKCLLGISQRINRQEAKEGIVPRQGAINKGLDNLPYQ